MKSASFSPPMHYADWFKRHAVTRGSSVAIQTPNARLDYAGFHRALHAMAFRLAESGIEAGQTVAVSVVSPILYCVVIAALNRIGCVPVGLARASAEEPVRLPNGLTIDRTLVEKPNKGVRLSGAIEVNTGWIQASIQGFRAWQGKGLRDADATAHIFAIPGTFDALKAVGCSTRQIEARLLRRSVGVLSRGYSGKILCQFGLRSSIGFQTTFATFWAGGTIYLGYPEAVIPAVVARDAIGRIEGSTAHFQAMLSVGDLSKFDLSSLHLAVVGGNAIAQTLSAAIRDKLCRNLVIQYGSSELGMISFGPMRAVDPSGSCGHLVPWMHGEAADKDGGSLPAGTQGNLRFRCEGMTSAYLNDSKANEVHFRDGWFYPGEWGAVSANRQLMLAARSSESSGATDVQVNPPPVAKLPNRARGRKNPGQPRTRGVPAVKGPSR